MENIRKDLILKGWDPQEAKRTEEIIENPEKQEKHGQYKKQMHASLYWGMLIVLIVCNFLVALVLVPVLLFIAPAYTALLLFFIGAATGLFFNLLVTDIEHIEQKHQLIASAIVPLTAVINIFVMVGMANLAAERLGIVVKQHPFWYIVSYVAAFLLPSVMNSMFVKNEKK